MNSENANTIRAFASMALSAFYFANHYVPSAEVPKFLGNVLECLFP